MALLGMATRIAAEGDVSLVHALVRWRLVQAGELARALADGTGLAVKRIDQVQGPLLIPLPRVTCARLRIIPVWRRSDVVGLGMADPTDDGAAIEVARTFGVQVERLLIDDDDLDLALRRVFGWAGAPSISPTAPPSLSAPPTITGPTAAP